MLPLIVITGAMAASIVWAYLVWRSPHRSDLASYGQYLIALVVLVGGVIAWAWRWRLSISSGYGPPTAAELDELADRLTQVVKDEWTRAANERRLLAPGPIPVKWRWPSVPIAEAVSTVLGAQGLQPLPGMTAVTAERLKGGEIQELHELYGGVGSGRLVIAGAPGSGKSGAAVLLILAALRHREGVGEADRSKVPVPVMFTLHGWDPGTQPIQDWLTTRLGHSYPQLAGPVGATKATLLLATGKIAVILDGLDEVPEELRPMALQGLSQQATFRLVVLTRLDEMAVAAARSHLEGAAAVELQDIDPQTAAEYLNRVQLDPAPPGWRELTKRLRETPADPLAQALNTPLTLTLVRDTYREGDNVRELLDFCGSGKLAVSRDAIVDHLLDRILPTAYRQKPGHPLPTYDLETAQHALCHIAVQMNLDGTRDLRWWFIPEWIPSAPRALTSGAVVGVGVAVGAGIAVGIALGAVGGAVVGAVVGVAFGAWFWTEDRKWTGEANPPQPIGRIQWREVFRGRDLAIAVAFGAVMGFEAGFVAGVAFGVAVGIAIGIAFGVVVGIVGAVGLWVSSPEIQRINPLTPFTAWRGDQASAVVLGIALGAVGGVFAGLLVGVPAGVRAGAGAGAGTGAVVGIAIILAYPSSSTAVGFAQLSARWHVPVQMMKFLEDAHQRNVLRTIGPVYQFRHGRLQDRLAEQALATCQNRCKSHGHETA
jgi:hypothetical protein